MFDYAKDVQIYSEYLLSNIFGLLVSSRRGLSSSECLVQLSSQNINDHARKIKIPANFKKDQILGQLYTNIQLTIWP